LHHTNIVSVFDYGEHDGICYYAMQFIAGHSLARVFEDVKQLKWHRDRAGKPQSRSLRIWGRPHNWGSPRSGSDARRQDSGSPLPARICVES
jgi:serine/threonine protein kinase